jgi:hypothetical protein
MKNLKKLVATATLMGIIIIGVTNVNAGIIVSLSDKQQCTEIDDTKVDNGIIVSLTGIIVSLTGIIVSYNDSPQGGCAE